MNLGNIGTEMIHTNRHSKWYLNIFASLGIGMTDSGAPVPTDSVSAV
jgi:hypothetical protein